MLIYFPPVGVLASLMQTFLKYKAQAFGLASHKLDAYHNLAQGDARYGSVVIYGQPAAGRYKLITGCREITVREEGKAVVSYREGASNTMICWRQQNMVGRQRWGTLVVKLVPVVTDCMHPNPGSLLTSRMTLGKPRRPSFIQFPT